ncbi:MAG: hypothetical protein GY795_25420, partial [Desulfobacterales bacterium]|nr:hypothetical protein [Desulfobacterales bacterium]
MKTKRTQRTLFVGPFVVGAGDGKDGKESQSLDPCIPNLIPNPNSMLEDPVFNGPAVEVPVLNGPPEKQHSCLDFDFWNSNPTSFSVGRRPDSVDATSRHQTSGSSVQNAPTHIASIDDLKIPAAQKISRTGFDFDFQSVTFPSSMDQPGISTNGARHTSDSIDSDRTLGPGSQTLGQPGSRLRIRQKMIPSTPV